MDELEGIGWEPAPLPVERVRGARLISSSKEEREPPERHPHKPGSEDEEEAPQKRAADSYRREDEPEDEPAAPTGKPQPGPPEPDHLIDITI